MKNKSVRINNLESNTNGIFVHDRYLKARQANIYGVVLHHVPGHGGDVWFIKHSNSEDVGVYLTSEFVVL